MSEISRDALERGLAERFGDAAWDVAATCPQGHDKLVAVEHPDYDDHDDWQEDAGWKRGALCLECIRESGLIRKVYDNAYYDYDQARSVREDHHDDPTWHPGWRVGATPKPLTHSLDALVPLVEAWCAEQTATNSPWIYGFALATTEDGAWSADVSRRQHAPEIEEYLGDGYADTPAEALALAVRAAMQAEEGVTA